MSPVGSQRAVRPGLTVVIPTHGGRSSVLATVQAILANDDNDIEVVVVSDGESQVTRALLESVRDPRLRILEQAKAGSAVARNLGLHEAHYDWVSFVDDDDVPRPNWVHVWRRETALNPVAVTAAVAYWRDGRSDGERACRMDPGTLTMSASTLLAGSFWVKTDLVRAVDGYDPTLRAAQNQDLGLRICDFLTRSDQNTVIRATNEVVIDLFVEDARDRSRRYGSSRADSARIFLQRFAHRLEHDPQHKASLLRIIARDDRIAGRHAAARKAAWTALGTQPLNLQNLRSFGLACVASLKPSRSSI